MTDSEKKWIPFLLNYYKEIDRGFDIFVIDLIEDGYIKEQDKIGHYYSYVQKHKLGETCVGSIHRNQPYDKKIIKGKMNNEIFQISNQNLKTGTLIKISNPKNKEEQLELDEDRQILINNDINKKIESRAK